MAKKIVLWEKPDQAYPFLTVEPEEIEDAVVCGTVASLIEGAEVDALPLLQRAWDEYDDSLDNFINDVSEGKVKELQGYSLALGELREVTNLESAKEIVVFDYYGNSFERLSDYETSKVLTWWDGSKWRHEIMHPEDPNDIIEITVSSDSVDLDEWTGNNWQTGGLGWHAEVYKVLEGSKYPYLLRATSQWVGAYPGGYGDLMTKEDLVEFLKKHNRDVDEYMNKIDNLND